MGHWKGAAVLAVAGLMLAASATGALAGRSGGAPLDRQSAAWNGNHPHLTTLGRWQDVPGLTINECATGNVSAAVTMQFRNSGQFRLRVMVDGTEPLKPNAVGNISLPASPLLVTPTFVGTVASGQHMFAVQWKQLKGAGSDGIELLTGAVNLLYEQGSC